MGWPEKGLESLGHLLRKGVGFSSHLKASISHRLLVLDEWEIFLRLAGILAGQGAAADLRLLDQFSASTLIQQELSGCHRELWFFRTLRAQR